MPSPTVTVTPSSALVDEAVSIVISGLTPGALVEVRSSIVDDGITWEATATFRADADGRIDAERMAPVSGSYSGVEPMGLIWSQKPVGITPLALMKKLGRNVPLPQAYADTKLSVAIDGRELASVHHRRVAIADGVRVSSVDESGVHGLLYEPPGPGPHPGMIVLGGSSGGVFTRKPPELASRGYSVLSLAYFNYGPELPRSLLNIPLEYFENAIDWLRHRLGHDRIGLMGISRGGELVLLLGATFPDKVSAIVAQTPSAYIHHGIVAGAAWNGASGASWTLAGEPLPYVPNGTDWLTGLKAWVDGWLGRPVRFAPLYVSALEGTPNRDAVGIPVERIQAPLLIITGDDDQMWPAGLFAAEILSRLKAHGSSIPVTHLRYANAGHRLEAPYAAMSLTTEAFHPVREMMVGMGGTPRGNARAAADSWPVTLTFLAEHLKRPLQIVGRADQRV